MRNSVETKIEIEFNLPFSAESIFDFIIMPENMPLYEGAFLIPGIAHVESTTSPRKTGTRDFITNKDQSRHSSVTLELIRPTTYKVHIDKIESFGFKKYLAQSIVGFKEQWILTPDNQRTKIHRSLQICTTNSILVRFFARYILAPQLMASFRKHHKNISLAMSQKNYT